VNRLVKIFLLWLLIAALPMQGIAAVAMPVCGTTRHHDSAAAATAKAETGGATAHGHAGHFHRNDKQRAADSGYASHDASSDKDAGSSSSGTCQVCCVSAAMIPSGVNWTLPQRQQGQPAVAPDILFSGHISGGLERPPRSILV
jgi:hypothetical protein